MLPPSLADAVLNTSTPLQSFKLLGSFSRYSSTHKPTSSLPLLAFRGVPLHPRRFPVSNLSVSSFSDLHITMPLSSWFIQAQCRYHPPALLLMTSTLTVIRILQPNLGLQIPAYGVSGVFSRTSPSDQACKLNRRQLASWINAGAEAGGDNAGRDLSPRLSAERKDVSWARPDFTIVETECGIWRRSCR